MNEHFFQNVSPIDITNICKVIRRKDKSESTQDIGNGKILSLCGGACLLSLRISIFNYSQKEIVFFSYFFFLGNSNANFTIPFIRVGVFFILLIDCHQTLGLKFLDKMQIGCIFSWFLIRL